MIIFTVKSEHYVAINTSTGDKVDLGLVYHKTKEDAILDVCDIFDVSPDDITFR